MRGHIAQGCLQVESNQGSNPGPFGGGIKHPKPYPGLLKTVTLVRTSSDTHSFIQPYSVVQGSHDVDVFDI